MKIREIAQLMKCNRIEKQTEVLEVLDSVIANLQHEMETNSLRLLGITMSY